MTARVRQAVVSRYAFRGTPLYSTDLFAEYRWLLLRDEPLTLRLESFNVFNHANVLARNGTYGDSGTPLAMFGQATPGLSSVEPGRLVQFQVRFSF